MKYIHLLYFLIIVTVGESCYDDVRDSELIDTITEAPEVIIDAGITGFISTADGEHATTMQVGSKMLTPDQSPYYFELAGIQQNHTTAIAYRDAWPVALKTGLIVNDAINILDLEATEIIMSSSIGQYQASIDDINIEGELKSGLVQVLQLPTSITTHGYNSRDELMHLLPQVGFAIIAKDDNNNLRYTLDDDILAITYDTPALSLYHLDVRSGAWYQIDNIDQYGYYLLAEDMPGQYLSGDVKIGAEKVSYQPVAVDGKIIHGTDDGRYRTISRRDLNTLNPVTPCGRSLSSIEIDTDDDRDKRVDITIDAGSTEHFRLTTRVVSCNKETVDYPIIQLADDNAERDLFLFDSEKVDFWIPTCGPSFDLSAWDAITATAGSKIPWTASSDDAVDLLSSCKDWDQGFAFLEIEGRQTVYTDNLSQTIDGMGILINIDGEKLQLRIDDNQVAKYSEGSVNISIDDADFGPGYFMDCLSSEIGCGLDNTTISHIYTSGELTRITFDGELWIQRSNPRSAGVLPVFGHILITRG